MKSFFKIAVVGLAVALMSACSSTKDSANGANGADGQGVGVGTAGGSGATGGQMGGAGNAATVFYFDFDKSELRPESRDALLQHAAALKAAPRNVRLEGHADERGTREYNIALGERRANEVARFLTLQGVNPSLIEVISYGEEKPAALGTDESSYSLNRRVELK